MTEVGANDKKVKKEDIIMSYELLDRDGRVAASNSGIKMFSGKMTVFNPTLWWPIGMSDTPGYLYTLKVSLFFYNVEAFSSFLLLFIYLSLWEIDNATFVFIFSYRCFTDSY